MSATEWRHAICWDCWGARYAGRRPVRLLEPDLETCCYCGAGTLSGMYVRADPRRVHANANAKEGPQR